jgi:putative oxidoreductase
MKEVLLMIKKCLATRVSPAYVDAALLLIRLVVGAAFMMHGWGKIQSPFSWMPPGSPVPGFFQFLAAISEFGGGLSLILGLLARLGSLGIVFTMMVAASMHAFVFHDPFVNMTGQGGSFELPLVYLSIAIYVVVSGPGRFSLDSKIFGTRS